MDIRASMPKRGQIKRHQTSVSCKTQNCDPSNPKIERKLDTLHLVFCRKSEFQSKCPVYDCGVQPSVSINVAVGSNKNQEVSNEKLLNWLQKDDNIKLTVNRATVRDDYYV